uniref:Sushi domain-containing protein n=1 Tax=Aquila chrysaetos chrysaetos TaxID=223781 RepID=A0A663F7U8_AQUCH
LWKLEPPSSSLCRYTVVPTWELRIVWEFLSLKLISLFLPVVFFLIGGCGAPPNLTFAKLTEEYKTLTEFPVGHTVRYSCQPGYMRHPGVPPTLTCLKNHTICILVPVMP